MVLRRSIRETSYVPHDNVAEWDRVVGDPKMVAEFLCPSNSRDDGGTVLKQWVHEANGRKYLCVALRRIVADEADFKAMTALDDGSLLIAIQGAARDVEANGVELDRLSDGLHFDSSSIAEDERKREQERAGFMTGVWHGVLLPFRALADMFCDVNLYADVNTGWGYRSGFLAGLLVLVGVLRRSGR